LQIVVGGLHVNQMVGGSWPYLAEKRTWHYTYILAACHYTSLLELCSNALTFELWYFPSGSFRKAFVASVTGQSHCNPTTAQEKTDLLTSCILIHTHTHTQREREKKK